MIQEMINCYGCNRLFDEKEIEGTGGYPTCKYSYGENIKKPTKLKPNREIIIYFYCYDKDNKYFSKENK